MVTVRNTFTWYIWSNVPIILTLSAFLRPIVSRLQSILPSSPCDLFFSLYLSTYYLSFSCWSIFLLPSPSLNTWARSLSPQFIIVVILTGVSQDSGRGACRACIQSFHPFRLPSVLGSTRLLSIHHSPKSVIIITYFLQSVLSLVSGTSTAYCQAISRVSFHPQSISK